MKRMSVAEAKAHFSACVELAESGRPVVITRHRKPVVAVVSLGDFSHLCGIRAAGPEEGLAGLAGGWKHSDELVRIVRRLRRSPSRSVPDLD